MIDLFAPAPADIAAAPPRPRHFPALTGLRFVLAVWVILHHLTGKGMMLELWLQSLPAPAKSLVRGGCLAVGTFFVLSGFVLARSYGETLWNRRSLIRYGIAPVARVFPAYLLSLIIVTPFVFDWWCTDSATSGKAAQILNYSFVLQGWMPRLSVFWNTPAWSLSCELFFYLCFPLRNVSRSPRLAAHSAHRRRMPRTPGAAHPGRCPAALEADSPSRRLPARHRGRGCVRLDR